MKPPLPDIQQPAAFVSSLIVRREIFWPLLLLFTGIVSLSGCVGDDASGGDVESSQTGWSRLVLSAGKTESLLCEASYALRKCYEGISTTHPNEKQASKCKGCPCWPLTDTGDAIWPNLLIIGGCHERFVNLQFTLTNVARTNTDRSNKATTKVQANTARELKDRFASGTVWCDVFKRVVIQTPFLTRYDTGNWLEDSPNNRALDKPVEDFGTSAL